MISWKAPLPRCVRALASGCVLAGALFAVALPTAAGAESCPNEEIRAEQGSEALPDCRAFELVTPEVKGDNSSIESSYGFADGNHVFFGDILPLPGAQSEAYGLNLSARTGSGWVTTPLNPPAGPGEPLTLLTTAGGSGALAEGALTSDGSAAFVNSGFDSDPLDRDKAVDVYRMSATDGAGSLASLPDSGGLTAENNPTGTFIAGASADGSHVLFQTESHLATAPGTPIDTHPLGESQLYDRTGGHTYVVGVLPDGRVADCAGLGDGTITELGQGHSIYGAVSPDGSNVVFSNSVSGCLGEEEAKMYLRVNNRTTVELMGGAYIERSPDGSKVFTTTGAGEGQFAEGVYEYDVATGQTTVITTEGWFVASSADGSRVYFMTGEGTNAGVSNARLYLWDHGATRLIPGAGPGFNSLVRLRPHYEQRNPNYAVATPDGSKLLFLDTASLTGYNNYGPTCSEGGGPGYCSEAYVYDASTGTFTCVSCNPTGAPPVGTRLGGGGPRGAALYFKQTRDSIAPPLSEAEISPDGSRVFFETTDSLVPRDTNGVDDVYEWENGRIYLISSGQGTYGSSFSGASSDGSNVFITTTDNLAPQDVETSTQIYDARVDGGFPYRPFTTGCDSGQCQGPQTPAPAFGPPASATFVGLGNPAPAAVTPPVKAKPKTKPKKKPKRKPRKRQRSKHTARRAGGTNGKLKGRK
jgi:hypothetical protein